MLVICTNASLSFGSLWLLFEVVTLPHSRQVEFHVLIYEEGDASRWQNAYDVRSQARARQYGRISIEYFRTHPL